MHQVSCIARSRVPAFHHLKSMGAFLVLEESGVWMVEFTPRSLWYLSQDTSPLFDPSRLILIPYRKQCLAPNLAVCLLKQHNLEIMVKVSQKCEMSHKT